jgi:ABC-2 type transport system permease protein
MRRYLRLYAHFLRFSFSRAMEFRVDFFFRVFMDTLFYVVQIAFFGVIYGHTELMGGWSFDQVLVFISGFFLVDALHMTLCSNNLWWLPFLVNRGDLDYYLVRPVSSLFFLSLREFAANSFLNLIMAAGISVWALARYPGELAPERIALYYFFIINGAFLYYIIHICFLIPVFWTHSGRGLGDLFFALQRYAERPEQIFRGYVRRLLVTLLPFSLVASFPARALFEGLTLLHLAHVGAVTALGFVFLRWFWQRALAAYSSASS